MVPSVENNNWFSTWLDNEEVLSFKAILEK